MESQIIGHELDSDGVRNEKYSVKIKTLPRAMLIA